MTESAAAKALVDTITKLAEAMTQLVLQVRAEKQMVELLFAISHTHRPETEALLKTASEALATLGPTIPDKEKPFVAEMQKRIAELAAIKATGFKPTVH